MWVLFGHGGIDNLSIVHVPDCVKSGNEWITHWCRRRRHHPQKRHRNYLHLPIHHRSAGMHKTSLFNNELRNQRLTYEGDWRVYLRSYNASTSIKSVASRRPIWWPRDKRLQITISLTYTASMFFSATWLKRLNIGIVHICIYERAMTNGLLFLGFTW